MLVDKLLGLGGDLGLQPIGHLWLLGFGWAVHPDFATLWPCSISLMFAFGSDSIMWNSGDTLLNSADFRAS